MDRDSKAVVVDTNVALSKRLVILSEACLLGKRVRLDNLVEFES